jgi:4-amino-4-deoxychorismate lyase
MCLCFETIKVKDGVLQNLEFHQRRVDKTRLELFAYSDTLCLEREIKDIPQKGIFRLRVDYKKEIELSTCKEYTNRELSSFKVVYSNISYDYKYAFRDELTALLEVGFDDIIIVKDGLLCDISIANIALYVQGVWLTPEKPLLEGTTRARLLADGFLKCADLSIKDLEKMEKFAIMNSLLGFKIIENVRIIN